MPVSSRKVVTSPWERAYLGFETPAEEERKFARRLLTLGATTWDRDSLVLDLFCGRGGATRALRGLGFPRIVALDLSVKVQISNPHPDRLVADCRALPVASACADIALVQGGLHHLPVLADDLPATLKEVSRVLRAGGLFVVVEPWRTPFLDFIHWVCTIRLARALSPRIRVLATMIEHERHTYNAWLENGQTVLGELGRYFQCRLLRKRFGKLYYVGVLRSP